MSPPRDHRIPCAEAMNTPTYTTTGDNAAMAPVPATAPELGAVESLSAHWREYLMEAALLATFMISACAFGGLYANSYQEVDGGKYYKNQSFDGNGGGASVSVYQRVNPNQRIPLIRHQSEPDQQKHGKKPDFHKKIVDRV